MYRLDRKVNHFNVECVSRQRLEGAVQYHTDENQESTNGDNNSHNTT